MTPCEELGYKVGDEFEVINSGYMTFNAGQVVVLTEDDHSECPLFEDKYGSDDGYVYLKDVKLIKPSSTDDTATSQESEYIGSPIAQKVSNDNTGAYVSIEINVEVKGTPFKLNRDEAYKLYQDLKRIFEESIT